MASATYRGDMAPGGCGPRPRLLANICMMRRSVRTNLAIVIVAIGLGVVWRALGIDGHVGGLGNIAFIVVGMLIVSLTDREMFWDIPPRRRR